MSLDSYSYLYGLARSALLGSLVSYWRGMLVVWESRLVVEVKRRVRRGGPFHLTTLHLLGPQFARPVLENAPKSWLRLDGYPTRSSAASLEIRLLDLIALLLDFSTSLGFARHRQANEELRRIVTTVRSPH